jgi:hypothetical protein
MLGRAAAGAGTVLAVLALEMHSSWISLIALAVALLLLAGVFVSDPPRRGSR